MFHHWRHVPRGIALLAVLGAAAVQAVAQQEGDGFRFRTGIELINVTATVTDGAGRFVPGLTKDDFVVYEDGVEQRVTHFSSERAPVSLGLVVDSSYSMAGEKWDHAKDALDRLLQDHLSEGDELFLYRFSDRPILVEDWTPDRERLGQAMRRINPRGATAMYDALAEAVPLASTGRNPKKTVIVISDGNDTTSQTSAYDLKQVIRQTEVLVYAIGIDGAEELTFRQPPVRRRPPVRLPLPFPRPGGRPTWPGPRNPQPPIIGRGPAGQGRTVDRVNAAALRQLTDDSGGRTEIVRMSRDLGPATAGVARELSAQYYLAYPAPAKKDGRWHDITVEVRDGRYRVRARRGYLAD